MIFLPDFSLFQQIKSFQTATIFKLKYYGKRIKIKKKSLIDFYYSCGIRQGGVISMQFCVSLINNSRNKH